jgi:tRNASer (uridine44-2'-O)-methyltransferase
MARHKKSRIRDPSQLSGKPLSETVVSSPLNNNNSTESEIVHGNCNHVGLDGDGDKWVTSPDLIYPDLPFTPDIMYSLITFLLGNPNVSSSHLFRADILFDSAGSLKTPEERERLFASSLSSSSSSSSSSAGHIDAGTSLSTSSSSSPEQVESIPAREIPGFELKRTVVRRLIPRNPRLDRALDQTCHFYEGKIISPCKERSLFVYTPHVSSKEDLPYYHPLLRSLAFLYEFERGSGHATSGPPLSSPDGEPQRTTIQPPERSGTGSLSVHFIPFSAPAPVPAPASKSESFDPFPTRLERTLQILLSTHVRLARSTRPSSESSSSSSSQQLSNTNNVDKGESDDSYNPTKDNVIPRHLVQNTYSRLKLKYAADLCRDWVEETEPSKHVFEDLAITAFLIELWRSMYGVGPAEEKETKEKLAGKKPREQGGENDEDIRETSFPGFVDVACGNGVLVYVLLMEGYRGWGFDARRRKTWAIFPQWVQDRLKESIYIPKPFADAVEDWTIPGVETHTGSFPKDTFIISNHADELTVWTPLMAALANPTSPLPFLAIPCCSHSLSGARFRYPPPKTKKKTNEDIEEDPEQNSQPSSGDLKALRAAKIAASTVTAAADRSSDWWNTGVLNSMYGSLTAKTMSIASELGYEVEKTLLRIPSTRNVGVIGGRRWTAKMWAARQRGKQQQEEEQEEKEEEKDAVDGGAVAEDHPLYETALQIVHRECAREGGIDSAARIWIQRATGLHQGQGKGRVRGERSGGGGEGEGSGH